MTVTVGVRGVLNYEEVITRSTHYSEPQKMILQDYRQLFHIRKLGRDKTMPEEAVKGIAGRSIPETNDAKHKCNKT